jgi:hypothetical protein
MLVLMKLLALLVVVGCSKSDDNKAVQAAPPAVAPTTGSDPWGAGSSSGSDPWGAGSPEGDPWGATADPDPAKPTSPEQPAPPPARRPPPPATGVASTLAGTYHCSMLSSGSRTGRYQTDYVPSAMGTFQIQENGAYSSATFPAKGSGRVSANAGTVTFNGGPYAGFIGLIGSVSSGATIRFGGVQTQPPTPSVHFNDHVCYRK